MDKAKMRQIVRKRKEILSESEKRYASVQVFDRLVHLPDFSTAKRILLYYSLPDELSTVEFIQSWHTRKQIYLPRVNGLDLEILPYHPNQTKLGAFNINEPKGNYITDLSNIDLIVVPAIAYDHNGNRIGRGKGYYDRLLAQSKATKIGIAYDCQIIKDIIPDPYDIPVDIVITEKHIYYAK